MAMSHDELCFFQTIDHRGGRTGAERGVLRQLRWTGRPLERDQVKTLHVGDVDTQELADSLMEEYSTDAIFSGPANDSHHQLLFVHFPTLSYYLQIRVS